MSTFICSSAAVLPHKPCLSARQALAGLPVRARAINRRHAQRAQIVPTAVFGEEQKKLRREDEPEEYWQSKAERSGNVLKDPLAIIGIVAIFLPFLLTLLAIATGLVELPSR